MIQEMTVLKSSRGAETLRSTALHTLAEIIRSGEYEKEVNSLRTYYPLMDKTRNNDFSLLSVGDLQNLQKQFQNMQKVL